MNCRAEDGGQEIYPSTLLFSQLPALLQEMLAWAQQVHEEKQSLSPALRQACPG